MDVHWLVETEPFEETAAGILAAIERAGLPAHRYSDDRPLVDLPPETRVLFYGSLNVAHEHRGRWPWKPGAVFSEHELTSSTYVPHLREHLLVPDPIFTTVEDLVASPGRVLGPLAGASQVFVRPDSPRKPFSGRVLPVAGLTLEALDHGFYYDDLDLPILVGPALPVDAEWRFVIAGDQVVTGCGYEPDGRVRADHAIPAGASDVARAIAASGWHPDPIFVADVCASEGTYRLVELNSFSCSDLYGCDPDAVVRAATEVARRFP